MAGQKNMKHRKTTRKFQANKRQQARDSRTTKEQLALIAARPGDSAKEVERLWAWATPSTGRQR